MRSQKSGDGFTDKDISEKFSDYTVIELPQRHRCLRSPGLTSHHTAVYLPLLSSGSRHPFAEARDTQASGWTTCAIVKSKQKISLQFLREVCCLVAKLCPTLCDPITVADQAPLSMGFTRQEHWRGLPSPSPGIFPAQGQNQCLLHLQADSPPLSRRLRCVHVPDEPRARHSGKCYAEQPTSVARRTLSRLRIPAMLLLGPRHSGPHRQALASLSLSEISFARSEIT